MWLYILLGQVFLIHNAASTSHMNDIKHDASSDDICIDIVKNISRVNNALKEVIKNYKQLQEISKTLSFETEFEEEHINITNKRSEKEASSKTTPFPATSVLIFNEDDESPDDLNESSAKPLSKYKYFLNENVKEADDIPSSKSMELKGPKPIDITKEAVKSLQRIAIHNVSKPEPREPNEELKKVMLTAVSLQRAEDHTVISNNNRTKDEYPTTDLRPPTIGLRKNPQIKQSIKKIVYTETFPRGKIWEDIANKKPLRLRTDLKKGCKNARKDFNKRVVNKQKDQPEKSLEEEIAIKKDIFKTDVLRKAYGDNCLKVVVKKCFKACKASVKQVCRQYRCQRDFEEKFKEYCKTGCIKEFNAGEPNNTRVDTEMARHYLDFTRSGYCGASCLPIVMPNKTNATKSRRAEATKKSNIDILRGRIEKACQDDSRNKCRDACTFAYQQTCSSLECSSRQKESFKKTCKRQCEIVFVYYSSNSSRSSSRSDDSETSSWSTESSSSDSESTSTGTSKS